MFKFKSLVITFRLKYLFQDTNQRIENIVMEYSYDYLGYVSKDYFGLFYISIRFFQF